MDRFLKIKRKKSPGRSQQPTPSGEPTKIAAGSSNLREEQGVVPRDGIITLGISSSPGPAATDNGSSRANSRTAHQDEALELCTSGLAVSGTGHGNGLMDGLEDGAVGVRESGPAESSWERACQGSMLGEATTNTGVTEEVTESFYPLKVSLRTISAALCPDSDKGTVAVGNRIDDLLARIIVLKRHFDLRPSDVEEQRSREELRRNLENIKEQLQPLAEVPELHSEEISGILENMRETIFDYQMVRQRKVDEQQRLHMDRAEATVLNSFRSAQGAEYRHGNRSGCLKGTRGAVLDEIELWTRDFNKPPVYWLKGLAGTGKTTIAQSIAERIFADGRLGASFFCSQDFEDRRNLHIIFPTLAVQLARAYTEFRSVFVPLVRSDPGVSHEALYSQMRRLIVQPLKESGISTVILIDALDECKDEEPVSAILSVLGQFVSEIPGVKFFVTGRPEPRIREGFRLPLLAEATDVLGLHEVEPSQVDGDIRLFFGHKFSELARRRRGLDGWPTEEHLDLLCKRAAGLFVYATATVKFIEKQIGNPRKQLDLLLQSPESSAREAKTKFKENMTLDLLYASILNGAFGDDDDLDNDPKIRAVLGAMILAVDPLSPSTIAALLNLEADDVFALLSLAQSLLILQEDVKSPVRPFHKSFSDFITNPDRCTNKRFHISPPGHHAQLLIGCLELMDQMLEKNICKLPDMVANSDVSDLEERIERYVDPALRYACRSWHMHLVHRHTIPVDAFKIASTLHRFLETKFLFWLEVLSVMGAVRNAVDALQVAMGWLEDSPTLDLANDCSRFVSGFIEIISASSPHIYHSALALTPNTSVVRRLYGSHAQPFVRVVHGAPASWDSNIAATARPRPIGPIVWSPCNGLIAVHVGATWVDLLDSATLQPLQRLEPPPEIYQGARALVFSPDGRMLTCSGAGDPDLFLVTWDIQTGSVVSVIKQQGLGRDSSMHRISYSTSGRTVGVLYQFPITPIISIYDVVSGTHTHNVDHGVHAKCAYFPTLPPIPDIWTYGESLRFAAATGPTTTIWEVKFTPGATPMAVETHSLPDSIEGVSLSVPTHLVCIQPLPTSCRLVFGLRLGPTVALLVWDTRDSKVLLYHTCADFCREMSFSSDGSFFAYSTPGSDIYLWKESSAGYILHGIIPGSSSSLFPLLSPNGESIIGFNQPTIQLWHTKSFTPNSSSIPAPASRRVENFVLEFHPDRPLAMVTRQKDNTVTVLDLNSGLPRLIIDAGMEVYGLGLIENTVVVIGNNKFISWNLPGWNFPPDAQMSVEDSAQTISFTNEQGGGVISASIASDFRFVAVLRENDSMGMLHAHLDIYDGSNGQYLGRNTAQHRLREVVWFDPGGRDLITANWQGELEVCRDTKGSLDQEWLQVCPGVEGFSYGTPWQSTHDYQVTDDGWILGSCGERLLMLPPHWRSSLVRRAWGREFLALLHGGLPEPVILNFEP